MLDKNNESTADVYYEETNTLLILVSTINTMVIKMVLMKMIIMMKAIVAVTINKNNDNNNYDDSISDQSNIKIVKMIGLNWAHFNLKCQMMIICNKLLAHQSF